MNPESFLRLSCVLTGEAALDPAMGQRLRARLGSHYEVALAAFVKAFEALPPGVDPETALRGLLDTQPQHNAVARAVVWAWYTGQFNTPYEVPDAPQTPDEYADGLLWKVIKAHAPGYKPGGFGSWAKLP